MDAAASIPPFPVSRYHPDPIRTGSITASPNQCCCCRRSRGYVYTLAPYTEEEVEERSLCPWCIADGSAHRKFGAEFIDAEGIPDDLPERVVEELVERTPGYAAWQTEEWRACCQDAAAFLGPFGYAEIVRENLLAPLLEYITGELQYDARPASRLVESLNRDNGPTAYVFECLHCHRRLFHVDEP